MSKQLRVYREGAKTEFDYQILWKKTLQTGRRGKAAESDLRKDLYRCR